MRVALSADMEGIAQITDIREILAGAREYWQTGKRRMTDDVVAAARGLLGAGASEVVVLDNHGSGNPVNIAQEDLPPGARLETWNVFDLRQHGVEAMLQVGYHARCGVDGFISHSYVPHLRLRAGDELISESHGRIWAAAVPLLGIVGNDSHAQTLGSLSGTPFLAVQQSRGRTAVTPRYGDGEASAAAIVSFAEQCLRQIGTAPRPAPPAEVPFAASLPSADADAQEPNMLAAGWKRMSDSEFAVELRQWTDAREPLAAAMAAAMAPFAPYFAGLDLTSAAAHAAQDPERLRALEDAVAGWVAERESQWLTGAPLAARNARGGPSAPAAGGA